MMDLVVQVDRRPQPGETVVGRDFGIYPGGKGFNQAVTAARLGAAVRMIGCLGADAFGQTFVDTMESEGIDWAYVRQDRSAGTGVGIPVVDAAGQNAIVIVPRANLALTAADVEQARPALAGCDVLLVQLEAAPGATLHAVRLAQSLGRRVIVNPAPFHPAPEVLELINGADVVTPNETECAGLTGVLPGDTGSARQAAAALLRMGARAVVITMGSGGAYYSDGAGEGHIPAHAVPVADTTGAGDAFNGALAVSLAAGRSLGEAVRYANAAGAVAVTRLGALPSMPAKADLDALLLNHRSESIGS